MQLRFKLDENLGIRGQDLLRQAGYDVATVYDQDLVGVADDFLIDICGIEKRCLVTLDLDFSNPLRYPPAKYSGIVVIRLSKNPSYQDLLDSVETLIAGISRVDSLHGKLWTVARQQIREYAPLRD